MLWRVVVKGGRHIAKVRRRARTVGMGTAERMKLKVMPEVRLAPFQLSSSKDVKAEKDKIAILVNCGIHASRVVGKGGLKIQEISGKSGACLRVTKTSGLCEVKGSLLAVSTARHAIFEIIAEGDVRDLRAAVAQALTSSEKAAAENTIALPSDVERRFLVWEAGKQILQISCFALPYRFPARTFEPPLNLQ